MLKGYQLSYLMHLDQDKNNLAKRVKSYENN